MTFVTTFVWELMQWIAIVGLVLVVAFLYVAFKAYRIMLRAEARSFLDFLGKRDDDA